MNIMDRKILLGPQEVSGQITLLAQGLNEKGLFAKSLSQVNPLGYNVDYCFSNNSIPPTGISRHRIKAKILLKSLNMIGRYDIYHFFMFKSLLSHHNFDLPLLKLTGAKILMEACGDEIRLPSIAQKVNPYLKRLYKENPKDLFINSFYNGDQSKVENRLRYVGKYVKTAISPDEELEPYLLPYFDNVVRSRQPINIKQLKPQYYKERNGPVRVLYRPSQGSIKGSHWVLPIIEELKYQRSDIEFVIPSELLPKSQFLKLIEKCDVVIDQFCLGSYGALTLEAMALGKAVISYIREDLIEKYPAPPPIFSRGIDYLKSDLLFLANNRDAICAKGVASRDYVEKYHDHTKISENLIEIYKSLYSN
jgi:hypothetical protein